MSSFQQTGCLWTHLSWLSPIIVPFDGMSSKLKPYGHKIPNATKSLKAMLAKSIARLVLAGNTEFSRAIHVHSAPMCLVGGFAVSANRGCFSGLIEGLEIKQIDAPVKHATHTRAPVLLRILGACKSRACITTTVSGPASFYILSVYFGQQDRCQVYLRS